MKNRILLLFAIGLAFNAQGQSWVAQTSGTTQNLNCVFFIGKDTGYAGGNGIINGTLLKTVDGGTTWNSLSFPSSFAIVKMVFITKDTGYVLTGNSQLYKTTNGGSSWAYIKNIGYYGTASSGIPLSLYFQNSLIGVINNGWANMTWRTQNGGVSWDSALISTGGGCSGGCWCQTQFISDSVGYASSITSKIYKTSDSGSTWTFLSTPTTNQLYDFHFQNINLGFAVGNLSGYILKTSDGGTTWTTISTGTSSIWNKLFFTSSKNAFILSSGSILVSNDTCNTWTAMGIYPSTSSFNDLFMVNDSIGYAVGYGGIIYKTFPGAVGPPSTASSSLYTSSINNTSMTVNWSSGNGTRRMVIARASNNSMSNPTSGTSYTANSIFGSGNTVGSGNYVVYDGTGSSCSVTGLSLSTTYFFRVYDYNGTGTTANYLTTSYASGGSSTLPVNWLNFSAELKNKNYVQLNWSTASEINNNYFEVQRSIDGSQFTAIGKVKGNGNKNSVSNYQFIDVSAPLDMTGSLYYRLKQVDFDGKFEFSKIVTVNLESTNSNINIYPNPTNSVLNISFTPQSSSITINLCDVTGRILKNITTSNRNNQIDVSDLSNGIYFINISGQEINISRKIIINK